MNSEETPQKPRPSFVKKVVGISIEQIIFYGLGALGFIFGVGKYSAIQEGKFYQMDKDVSLTKQMVEDQARTLAEHDKRIFVLELNKKPQ